ncbi:hypothetical protein BO71DRAFT_400022, partial [Aspergillus ellipticus CBS 707.79]
VRRDELLNRNSTSPSPSPPPESAPDAQKRLGQLLNLDSLLAPAYPSTETPQSATAEVPDDEEQEFEFRLFSAPAATATKSQTNAESTSATAQKLRIRVRSPTPGAAGLEDGRFVNPFRGWGHYFSAPELMAGGKGDELEEERLREKRRQFEDIAVSGVQMLGFAQVPWPGCYLPWKVTTLKEKKPKGPADGVTTCVVDPPERLPLSHKKPGKKRRVLLRKRVTAAQEAKKKAEEAKVLDAEKRNRKNRERKIKRRQKARELKAAAAADGSAPPVEMDEDVSSDGGSD